MKKVSERLITLKKEADEDAQKAGPSSPPPPATQAPAPTATAEPARSTPTREPERSGGTGRVVGIVAGGVGLASLGASGVLSLLARKKNSDADGYCSGTVCRDSRGVDLAHQAGDFATGATITFVSGAALLSTGIVVYLLSSGKEEPKPTALNLTPVVGPAGSGVSVYGSF